MMKAFFYELKASERGKVFRRNFSASFIIAMMSALGAKIAKTMDEIGELSGETVSSMTAEMIAKMAGFRERF